ncbi:hypothetical protein ILUMI_03156 [Ignelater luminosus]|uniref:Heat shock protein 70 n=1 Tax=Ignelater luminosus TaxID=2038154 RepID=A0A8K0DC34_IGNLU|nr:hypothetical protein ILUMI_03156 [Ignelater luminosus]
MSQRMDKVAIGIDLGTTHCSVAHINENGVVDIIANKDGDRTTPSYIALTKKGIIIGKIAKDQHIRPPENAVYDSKRLIGRYFNDKYLQNDIKKWTFKVKNSNDRPIIELELENRPIYYRPEEISGMLLDYMKKAAEDFIGKPVTDAIITVPAHFNYHQRAATTEAGKLAGLNVLGIINEPTAAALAYIHKNSIKNPRNILIYDLGGGTFDVSIVKIKSGSITVAASAGNTHLGGRDFDNNLIDLINDKIEKRFGKEALNSEATQRRIKAASERMKIKLSTVDTTFLDLDRLYNGEDVEMEISRSDFEEINSSLFEATINIVQHCLQDAKLKNSDIDDIVLVGGSTRIPKVQEILSKFFEGRKLSKTINPDEAVAYGAAVKTQSFLNCNKTEVITATDVTSLSLGVDIYGNIMNTIVPRNTPIPCTCTESFHLVRNKVAFWKWKIFEGERALCEDNIFLGECCLDIPLKPPGYLIDLTFNIDENGIVQVSVRYKHGLHKTLPIVYKQQNSQCVNDILRDAEANKSNDKKIIFVVNRFSDLDDQCSKLEALCDYDSKNMSNEDKTKIRNSVVAIQEWIHENLTKYDSEIVKEINKKIEEVNDSLYPIVEKYGYSVRNLSLTNFYEYITEK